MELNVTLETDYCRSLNQNPLSSPSYAGEQISSKIKSRCFVQKDLRGAMCLVGLLNQTLHGLTPYLYLCVEREGSNFRE